MEILWNWINVAFRLTFFVNMKRILHTYVRIFSHLLFTTSIKMPINDKGKKGS